MTRVCARHPVLVVALVAWAVLLGACNAPTRDPQLGGAFQSGSYGDARLIAAAHATTDPSDRSYMLDQVKYVLAGLAEGNTEAVEGRVDRLYDALRTQGVNSDATVGSFLFGERAARIWKGEPFEQAMMYHYVGVFDGLQGDWGNVRADESNSLFLLRDFSQSLRRAGELTSDPYKQREAIVRAANDSGKEAAGPDQLPVVYTPVQSDFEIGYVMKMIAARKLGQTAEVQEIAGQLRQLDSSRLGPLADAIAGANYNTVIVADYGLAPMKYGAGPDGAIAMYRPVTPSDNRPLIVSVNGHTSEFPVVTDLNRLALDVRWTNLEDMRIAKSTIGDALVLGGTTAVIVGASQSNSQTGGIIAAAGAGAALIGALMKATSGADLRQVDVLPQRVYVGLLYLAGPSDITLQVSGDPRSRVVLPGVPPADAGGLRLLYARLPSAAGAWAASGRVLYSNDATGPIPGPQLPYILGGRCVRTPTWDVLHEYQASGYLKGMNLSELIDLYREEGIVIAATANEGQIGRHILEGGDTLYSPVPGSVGLSRLMCSEHAAYRPKSARARELAAQAQAQSLPQAPATNLLPAGATK